MANSKPTKLKSQIISLLVDEKNPGLNANTVNKVNGHKNWKPFSGGQQSYQYFPFSLHIFHSFFSFISLGIVSNRIYR